MYACAHFRYVTCPVRVCTDLLSGMAGRLERDVCRLIDRIRGSKVRIQQKLTPLKCCARPSSMEHFKCPLGSDSLIGTRAAGHPFLATAKMQKKKMGTGVPPVFTFRPNFPTTRAYRRPYKKMENLLFCPFGRLFFFGASFCLFFVLFYPNKSYAWIFRGFP